MLFAFFLAGCEDEGVLASKAPTIYSNLRDVVDSSQPILVVVGVVLLIAGWKLYDWIVAAPGIVVGGMVAAILLRDQDAPFLVLGVLIGAGIGALLALFIHGIVIWGIGAILGSFLFDSLWVDIMRETPPDWLFVVGVFVGGFAFVALYDLLEVVIVAAIGAGMIGIAFDLNTLWIGALFLAGLVIQWRLALAFNENIFTERKRRRKEGDD
ncbi:MAG TPA: hypothetical protein VJZ27_19205 [Aggregatilineales bacterium]|nr:hypothetical protein [Aggregatilineales bacterium]